jgi:hypothetical protein
MTTSGKKFCQYLGACVAALIITLGLTACSDDPVAADPQPTKTETVTPSPETVTLPPTTVTVPPSSTPTKTVAVTPKPSPKVTPTKQPSLKLGPNQEVLTPMWETAGDPGGPKWAEAGIGGTTGDVKCAKNRDPIDFKVTGSKTVRGSKLIVTETNDYMVVRTNLKSTALLVNGDAAAKLPEKFWKRAGMPPMYTFFLPKPIWEKALGSDIYSIWACAVLE